MFKYHKYCVIEASGIVVGVEGVAGSLDFYLIDREADDTPTLSADSERIIIADPALIDYLMQHGPKSRDARYPYRMQARITGTVSMDGEEVSLLEVSEAFLQDGKKSYRYRP